MVWVNLALLIGLALTCPPAGRAAPPPADRAERYLYRDNRNLVRMVEAAAGEIERRGAEAFSEFADPSSRWLTDRYYLFVYDAAGVCVFHPIEAELVGRDLSEFRDVEERPVIEMIREVGRDEEPDASGWVFYLWEGPWHSYPRWKGSYIRKAVDPAGRVLLVGSGIYGIKIEKEFIRENVDRAALMIVEHGPETAFRELGDRSSPLHILDSYIYVQDEEGNLLVDPMFPGLEEKRNISGYLDYTGRSIFLEGKQALAEKESAWIMYLAPRTASGRPVRHLSYLRKVESGGETFYVGASFVPPEPIWMKK